MTPEQLFATLWARRRLLIATFLACMMVVVLLVVLLPRSYRATATLVARGPLSDAALAEQAARTYAALAGNPNVAEQVRRGLPFRIRRRELLEHMSFTPVERTQLVEIAAEFGGRQRAQIVANLYARIFARRIQARDGANALQISDLATRPADPVRPNPPLYLGFGFALSLLLAASAALLRDLADRRVRVGASDTELHGVPIAARVPPGRLRDQRGSDEVGDAYRLLRAAIDLGAEPEAGHVVLVTEAGDADAAARVAVGLAATASADGERVVLVDADLRGPRIDGALRELGWPVRDDDVGLVDVLAQRTRVDDVAVTYADAPRLAVVWSGPALPGRRALLASEQMRLFVSRMRGQFDRVVIFAPPVLAGADTAALTTLADTTLLAVDAGGSADEEVRVHLDQLRTFRARSLRMVVIGVRPPRARRTAPPRAPAPPSAGATQSPPQTDRSLV